MYDADSADPKKSVPKQLVFDNTSGIPVFATDALAQVSNPAVGTITFSQQSNKIFVYNGTAWVKTAALS